MGLMTWLKGAWQKMFNKNDIEQEIKQTIPLSPAMQNALKLWDCVYKGSPPWVSDITPHIAYPSAFATEFARLALLEFSVNAEESKRASLLKPDIDRAFKTLRQEVENACAVGGMYMKPYPDGAGGFAVDFVPQTQAFPLSTNLGHITGVVFPEQITRGDTIFTRLEIHELRGTRYTIINKAYKSKDHAQPFAKEISLTAVPEWKHLQPISAWDNVKHPLFSYFGIPQKNLIDASSPLGASVFARAIEVFKDIDTQYGRLLWEYKATEAAVHVEADMFKPVYDSTGNVIETRIPEGMERLYRTYESSGQKIGEEKNGIIPYLPTIRDQSQVNGLNQLLMKAEDLCGLTRGTFSDDQNSANYTNELQLKLARNRAENTVHEIQKSLSDAVKDLYVAVDTMGALQGDAGAGQLEPESIQVSFGDSIVIDSTSDRERDRLDVQDGFLPKWRYIMKWYNLPEKEAKAQAKEAGLESEPPAENNLY